jgi:oxalate---CoA ligase
MKRSNDTLQIGDFIRRNAQNTSSAPALVSVDGGFVTWQQLLAQLEKTRASLSLLGLGGGDCVALALPNGPVLAQTFLSVAACATCAPLNLAYNADELAFYLRNVGARAIIISDSTPKPIIDVAAGGGLHVIKIQAASQLYGIFDLISDTSPDRRNIGSVTPDSIALLLHTSGTTASPKLVPLSHCSLMASASGTAAWLKLSPGDRCLNVMPLFHIHGLIGGLLSALICGGSSVCPPNFQPGQFFRWLTDTQATWYTAVPTMHRAIVDRTRDCSEALSGHQLRFIRSCSAPLPPAVFDELKSAFNVPIIEAYGMTEAAHQIASNPLPPGIQKPGTVGLPTGPEVRIANQAGDLLKNGTVGEVVIRGDTVMTGYRGNASANNDAFVKGWFRTGDLGRLDQDGYLILVGRLKDQVNKGGMKISPLEVEEALLKHPNVSEAAAFGVSHPTLGETIGAAVVFHPAATATVAELRNFLRGRLAQFKIPHCILLLDQLPKGPTGKLQRKQLSEIFQLQTPAPPSVSAAEDRLEVEIATIWSKLLEHKPIDYNDDFFEIGGDSLLAVAMLLEIERLIGQPVPETILFEAPTIRQLARHLNNPTELAGKALIEVQDGADKRPFIFFHGNIAGGYYTRRLCKLLGPDQRFIAVVPHGIDAAPLPSSIEEMAAQRLPKILEIQPGGPFRLGGYCSGGLVAFELARLLTLARHEVEFVVMVDSPTFNARPIVRTLRDSAERVSGLFNANPSSRSDAVASAIDTAWRFASKAECLPRTPPAERMERILGSWRRRVVDVSPSVSGSKEDELEKQYTRRLRRYVPAPLNVPIVYFSAEYSGYPLKHLTAELTVIKIPGGHIGCITTELEILGGHISSLMSHEHWRKPAV